MLHMRIYKCNMKFLKRIYIIYLYNGIHDIQSIHDIHLLQEIECLVSHYHALRLWVNTHLRSICAEFSTRATLERLGSLKNPRPIFRI